VNGDKREGDCSGNGDVAKVFKVIEQNDKGNLVRDGVLTAVDFTGSALSAVFLPTGWGERYIVHWILLVIAKLEADKHGGKYTTPAIDVACHFEVWRKTMDKRATVAQEALSAAWSEASANGNLVWLLEQLLDPETDNVDSFPEWYTSILTDCADRLNESELRSPAVLKADVKSMHRGLSGMLTLLEAHAGVDFAATPLTSGPSSALRIWTRLRSTLCTRSRMVIPAVTSTTFAGRVVSGASAARRASGTTACSTDFGRLLRAPRSSMPKSESQHCSDTRGTARWPLQQGGTGRRLPIRAS
jgi:hypothetical protein